MYPSQAPARNHTTTLHLPKTLSKELRAKIEAVIASQPADYFQAIDATALIDLGRHELTSDELHAQLALTSADDARYLKLSAAARGESEAIQRIRRSLRLTINSRRRHDSENARAGAVRAAGRNRKAHFFAGPSSQHVHSLGHVALIGAIRFERMEPVS